MIVLGKMITSLLQMERMGQPLTDAFQAVNNVMGNALNVVFQLSSWFAEYETAPFTNTGDTGLDGVSHMPGLGSSNQWYLQLEERLYPARKWVCTKKVTSASESDPKSGMFWSLFKYIQGGNSMETKIEMTTPVSTYVKEDTAASTITYEMCFFIGSAFQDNTPTPSNTRVYIKEVPERKIFTRKVGGWMDQEKWEIEAAQLRELLTAKGLSFSDER